MKLAEDSSQSIPVRREVLWQRVQTTPKWDLVVIGGGATGLGVALDAASRGLSVALLEAEDFAKGTSSRATKLVHGGVRYLAQGNIALVREALRERAVLLENAPHLVQPLAFVMPVYGKKGLWFDKWFYGLGLTLYDLLAGKRGLGKTEFLSRSETLRRLPGIQSDNLSGAVHYWDGQFDDARLAVALARTAIAAGACVINHCAAVDLVCEHDHLVGVVAEERESGERHLLRARCVVNATGVWVDRIRKMVDDKRADLVAPSQGVHLVLDREFLPSSRALLVPRTSDGRVLFAVPWMGKTILGTTDTPRQEIELEPKAFDEEVDFILGESARYLTKKPTRADVRSIWVGLRPLVRQSESSEVQTKGLSREHTVLIDKDGLVTVTGGKWTTYRAMAEDVLQQCVAAGLLAELRPAMTEVLHLVGAPKHRSPGLNDPPGLHLYGTDAEVVKNLTGADRELTPGLTEAMVRFAVIYEQARSVEDMLARRSRLLFLDAALAVSVAPEVARIMADELGKGFDAEQSLESFLELAKGYQLSI